MLVRRVSLILDVVRISDEPASSRMLSIRREERALMPGG